MLVAIAGCPGMSSKADIYVINAASGKTIHTLKGHGSGVLRMSFSPDGKYLVSSGPETLVWNLTTGALWSKLPGA
jgi:WD40 repeat protein